MTVQNKKFTLDIAKVLTALTAIGGFFYYAGKLDEKAQHNSECIAEIKQDIKEIKSAIYQPVFRNKEESKLTAK